MLSAHLVEPQSGMFSEDHTEDDHSECKEQDQDHQSHIYFSQKYFEHISLYVILISVFNL